MSESNCMKYIYCGVARITDRLQGHIKITLIVLLVLATVTFTLLSLVLTKARSQGHVLIVRQ